MVIKATVKDGLPGYQGGKGECHTFPHNDMALEIIAYDKAVADEDQIEKEGILNEFLKGHFGTSEGVTAAWDTRGRGRKEQEKTGGASKAKVEDTTSKGVNAGQKLLPGNDMAKGTIEMQEVTVTDFIATRDQLPENLKAYLTLYTAEEYARDGAKTYLDKSGKGGFALRNGEGISLFSLPGAHIGAKLMDASIAMGMDKLDCIGEELKGFYKGKGFEVTQTLTWDDQYAPKGWDYEKRGRPNIYYMKKTEAKGGKKK
jgi:hypothetical protein